MQPAMGIVLFTAGSTSNQIKLPYISTTPCIPHAEASRSAMDVKRFSLVPTLTEEPAALCDIVQKNSSITSCNETNI
ncbi:hypothetical protein NC651_029070 [Populus alba x Populus x berolinensis]|nr:hypothetical protein NC651_029070 [Populus alba x Populus x berolinensis]